jgi:hypothetical protein
VVLNHILFSNIATIATTLISHEAKPYHPELVQLGKKAFSKMVESLKKFGDEKEDILLPQDSSAQSTSSPDDGLIKEQLQFIHRLSKDIDKVSNTILFEQPKQGQLVALQA